MPARLQIESWESGYWSELQRRSAGIMRLLRIGVGFEDDREPQNCSENHQQVEGIRRRTQRCGPDSQCCRGDQHVDAVAPPLQKPPPVARVHGLYLSRGRTMPTNLDEGNAHENRRPADLDVGTPWLHVGGCPAKRLSGAPNRGCRRLAAQRSGTSSVNGNSLSASEASITITSAQSAAICAPVNAFVHAFCGGKCDSTMRVSPQTSAPTGSPVSPPSKVHASLGTTTTAQSPSSMRANAHR